MLNQLARQDAAVVTEVPGTTRNPYIATDGVPVIMVDTAAYGTAPNAWIDLRAKDPRGVRLSVS